MDEVIRGWNYANLKKMKVGELKKMLKSHTWKGEVISVSSDLELLIKCILKRKTSVYVIRRQRENA